jgi:hypothetical protein
MLIGLAKFCEFASVSCSAIMHPASYTPLKEGIPASLSFFPGSSACEMTYSRLLSAYPSCGMPESSIYWQLTLLLAVVTVEDYNFNNNSSGYALAMWPSTSHLA